MVPQPDAIAFGVLKHRKRPYAIDIGWGHNNGRPALFGTRNGSIQVVHCDINRQIRALVFINLMNATVNPHACLGANGTNGGGFIDIPAKNRAVELPQFRGIATADLEMNNWIGHISDVIESTPDRQGAPSVSSTEPRNRLPQSLMLTGQQAP